MAKMPSANERWRYKKNRGSGTFTIVRVTSYTDAAGTDGRVTLRDWCGKDKTVSFKTLRGDYEPVPT